VAFDLPSKEELIFLVRHPVRWYREAGPADPYEAGIRRKQIRMILYASAAALLILSGAGVWQLVSTLEARSELAYSEGERLLRPGAYEDAISKFDWAIRLNGQHAQARLARAEALIELNRREEALAELSRVIGMQPNWSRGYSVRARVYVDAKDYQKALADLSASIDIEETSENLLSRGLVYEQLGEYRKAIADCDRYIRMRDGVPYAYELRSRARRRLGDEAGAREDKWQALVYEGRMPPVFTQGMPEIPAKPEQEGSSKK
jgi:tetratricopeptide (TPR) repeat protein